MTAIYINSVVINNINNIVIFGNTTNNIVSMQINNYFGEEQTGLTVKDFDDHGKSKGIVMESLDYTKDKRLLSLQKRLEACEKELEEIRETNKVSLDEK